MAGPRRRKQAALEAEIKAKLELSERQAERRFELEAQAVQAAVQAALSANAAAGAAAQLQSVPPPPLPPPPAVAQQLAASPLSQQAAVGSAAAAPALQSGAIQLATAGDLGRLLQLVAAAPPDSRVSLAYNVQPLQPEQQAADGGHGASSGLALNLQVVLVPPSDAAAAGGS